MIENTQFFASKRKNLVAFFALAAVEIAELRNSKNRGFFKVFGAPDTKSGLTSPVVARSFSRIVSNQSDKRKNIFHNLGYTGNAYCRLQNASLLWLKHFSGFLRAGFSGLGTGFLVSVAGATPYPPPQKNISAIRPIPHAAC